MQVSSIDRNVIFQIVDHLLYLETELLDDESLHIVFPLENLFVARHPYP